MVFKYKDKLYFYGISIITTQLWRGILLESDHPEDQEGESMYFREIGYEDGWSKELAVVRDRIWFMIWVPWELL
jgi:hypothetical protein